MKKITNSIIAALAVSSFAFGGGDIQPVEPMIQTPVAEASTPVDFYAGVGYSYIYGEQNGTDMDTHGFTLTAGVNFNPYLGVEGRYTANVSDVSVDGAADTNADISNLGIYLKPMLPMDAVTLYGLIGYGKLDLDDVDADAGFQWGIGASVALNAQLSAFVDYTNLYDDTVKVDDETVDATANQITVGVTYKFN